MVNIAPAISLTASSRSWSIGAGWWMVMAVCMLFMAAMMLAMMWRGNAGWGGWPRWWSGRWPEWPEESPIDILERRFAAGEISVEDYRKRREALAHAARGQDDAATNGQAVASGATRKEEP